MKKFFNSLGTQFGLLNRTARLFLLALFLDGLLFAGWNLFFNLYFIASGHSRDFLGLANAAPSLSALLLGVPMGLLSDRLGRKRAMIIGFSLANLCAIGMMLAKSEGMILGLALVFGATAQLYVLSHAPFMMKLSDDKSRDILFSFSFGMYPLASTAGSFLVGYMPSLFTRWFHLANSAAAYQAVLVCFIILSYLVLVPIAFIREPKTIREQANADEKPPRSSIWKVMVRPLTLKLTIPNLVIGLGAAMLVPYFNVFFAERFGMSDAALGSLFAVGAFATGVACIIGPRLVGNLGGKIQTIVLGQGISLIFLLTIGFSPWPWLAIAGYLVRGAMMNMVAPLFDAFALERCREVEHGAVNSIRNLAWNLGWTVGPYLSGLVQQRWGFTPLFVNTAVLYALGIGLTWIFFRPGKAPEPELEPVPAVGASAG